MAGSARLEIKAFYQQCAYTSRYQNLKVELRSFTGEPLFQAGGTWDQLTQQFIETPTGLIHSPHILTAEESQDAAARNFAAWLHRFTTGLPREISLEMFADNRRGGKTFFMVLWVLLTVLHVPRVKTGRMIGWLVVPNYPRQREIRETIAKILPTSWLKPGGPIQFTKSDRCYRFCTGAELYIKSADDPDGLKEGGVPIIGINEAQQVQGKAAINCLGNNLDAGGLTILALNPPDSVRGLWCEDLYEAIVETDPDTKKSRLPYARITTFPPGKNRRIEQSSRKGFASIVQVIDPKQEQRDNLGMWVSITDRCYPKWDQKNIQPVPTAWEDGTVHVIGLMNCFRGASFPYGAGMDFNWRPYCATVRVKVLKAPERNTLGAPAGSYCYFVTEEVMNDISVGEFWTEEGLARAMFAAGWSPQDTLIIADASGGWQGSSGRQRGKDADPETFSYRIMESYYWRIFPPQESVQVHRRLRQKAVIEEHAQNPPVPMRINLMNQLLEQKRLFVDPKAERTAEAFRRCEAKNKKPVGKYSHAPDAAGYFIWRAENALLEAMKRK